LHFLDYAAQQYCIAQSVLRGTRRSTMQNQAFENIGEVGELSLETAKRLGGWNSRLWDKLTEQQLAGVALWVDAGIKQLRLLGESQNPYDIYAGQTQLAQEYAERVSEYMRQTLAIMADVQNELSSAFTPRVKESRVPVPISSTPEETIHGVAKPKIVDRPQQ
jgi:phasin family protein